MGGALDPGNGTGGSGGRAASSAVTPLATGQTLNRFYCHKSTSESIFFAVCQVQSQCPGVTYLAVYLGQLP